MKTFAEFYQESTGYVEGSIPPQFSKGNVKLIPACGSDSIIYFDGRYSLNHCINLANEYMIKNKFKGFKIHKGDLRSNHIIFSTVNSIKKRNRK